MQRNVNSTKVSKRNVRDQNTITEIKIAFDGLNNSLKTTKDMTIKTLKKNWGKKTHRISKNYGTTTKNIRYM